MTNQMLVFGGNHNGINCIQNNAAERPCDKVWFTEAQICEWSSMSHSTLWRRLKKLEEVGRISSCSDLNNCKMPIDNGGYQNIKVYNLNVLNQLAMVELDCPVLNETSKKFSDILSEVETTGTYSIKPKDSYMIDDPIERAKAWIAEQEEHRKQLALQVEQTERALEREAEAIRTKAYISDKKTAKAMATASKFSRENKVLKAENRALKDGWYTKYDIKNLLSFPYELSELSKAKKALELSKAMSKVLNTLNPSGIYQRMFTCGTVTNKGKEYPMTEYRFSYEVVDFLVPWLKQNPYLLRMRKYWEDSMFQFCKPYFSKML